MKKVISAGLILAVTIISLSSCIRKKFKYMHDTSEIARIEVVEFTREYDHALEKDVAHQLTLATVADSDDFISRLSKIPHHSFINGELLYIDHKCIAFKVSYSNGDYEVFTSSARAWYYSETDHLELFSIHSGFNSKKIGELMHSYVSDINGVYTFMHDVTEITRIEYVNITNEDGVSIVNEEGQKTHEVINEIADIDEFIRDQQSMRYIYEFDPEYEDAERPSTGKCFIITYANGDYEHFNQSRRIEASIRDDGNGYYKDYVNMGRFAPDDYAAFEAKYAGG